MTHAFLGPVRMTAPQDHADCGKQIRNSDHEADGGVGNPEPLHDLRNPEDQSVLSELHAEIAKTQRQNARIREC